MTKHEFGKQFYEDPLYEYVRELALYRMADSDECGPLDTSIAGEDMMWAILNGKVDFNFTRENYDDREDIQNSIKAIGLDVDKFWELVRFINYYGHCKFNKAQYLLPSKRDRIVSFLEGLLENDAVKQGVSLVAKKGGKTLGKIDDLPTIEFLVEGIISHCKNHMDNVEFVGHSISRNEDDKSIGGLAHRICFEAEQYQFVFDKFCKDGGMPKRVKNPIGSRDKVLLISRLMYLTKLTDNPKFNDSSDSLKGIRNQYKDKGVETICLEYFN